MISNYALEQKCGTRTFARARTIASSERNILTRQVRYFDEMVIVSAYVASSSGWSDRYRTTVSFNDEEDCIVDYSCTCPAYREYDGMCKHCVALALVYHDNPEKFFGHQPARSTTTSQSLLDYLKQAEVISDNQEPFHNISLEPTLSYGYENWSVSFKISSPSGCYVIKHISDFVARMKTGETFSYGKKLSFAHAPSAFTPHAQTIIQFLDRAVSLRDQALTSSPLRPQRREVAVRDLILSDPEVIELLDLLNGKSFTIQGTDTHTRSITHAYIVNEDPAITINLEESEKDGFILSKQHFNALAIQGDRMYVWHDEAFYRCSPDFTTSCSGFLRAIYNNEESKLFIARTDMALFCSVALPAIKKYLTINAPESIKVYQPIKASLEFYLDKDTSGVSCQAWAVYGEFRYLLRGEPLGTEDSPDGPLRNSRLESRGTQLVDRYFYSNPPFIGLLDDDALSLLLFEGLALLKAHGDVFTTPAFDRLLKDDTPRVSLGVSLAGNLINLTVSSQDIPPRELSALLTSFRLKKRFHRLKKGAFIDLQDLDLEQLDRLVADLGISAQLLNSGTIELPAYRAFYLDEEEDLKRDRSFTRYVESFKSVNEQSYRAPSLLQPVLRPYQEEGFRWLSARCDAGFGGILADEMGLGKSIQLIAFLLSQYEKDTTLTPSLIVCPSSLVYNWLAELDRFAPTLSAKVIVGAKEQRGRALSEAFTLPSPHKILITSYDLLRIDIKDYEKRSFFCCTLDEAQYIKNPTALTTRAVKKVRSHHRFALSGTPVENRLSELWSIFDFLMPGLLGPYSRFRERFESPVVGKDERSTQRLQALVGPFLLRRLKSEVLCDLPDKLESIIYTPLEQSQQRLYSAHEQQLRESLTKQKSEKSSRGFQTQKVQILAELTKLRQICCDPHLLYDNYQGGSAKLETIMVQIFSAHQGGEKTLVFSQFTSFLDIIAQRLKKEGVPHYTITGKTPKKDRLTLVNAFNDDNTPVFLVSLKAGGTGLNLTGASVVIHADPWWNAAAQNQATDRAHRIGQTKVVNVQRIIAQNTIEERIVRLQEAKSELADQVIEANGISLSSLSQDDLLDLLKG